MVIRFVDHRQLNTCVAKDSRCSEAAEAAADYHDTWWCDHPEPFVSPKDCFD
jgi:hypothetical protein